MSCLTIIPLDCCGVRRILLYLICWAEEAIAILILLIRCSWACSSWWRSLVIIDYDMLTLVLVLLRNISISVIIQLLGLLTILHRTHGLRLIHQSSGCFTMTLIWPTLWSWIWSLEILQSQWSMSLHAASFTSPRSVGSSRILALSRQRPAISHQIWSSTYLWRLWPLDAIIQDIPGWILGLVLIDQMACWASLLTASRWYSLIRWSLLSKSGRFVDRPLSIIEIGGVNFGGISHFLHKLVDVGLRWVTSTASSPIGL